jgi:hypothetical protein
MGRSDRSPVTPPRLVVATKAYHLLGEISSEFPDWAWVSEEDVDNYYGRWVTGLGMFNVRFPKETTRLPTPDEEHRFSSVRPEIGGLAQAMQAYGKDRPLPDRGSL